jgi:hypothetical protein
MELQAVMEVVKVFGPGGLAVVACVYLMKAQAAREVRRDVETAKREEVMGGRINATEQYCRTTMAQTIDRNTEALSAMTATMRDLPCAGVRRDEIANLVEERRGRRGERV